ncbi:MAG: phosphomannomutase/phosphoglucomutase [Deltaproteobacteria bacterium]|nr:phosphomannomutase/phosphoglucomutase [Deltaproteobacteria bacterium]MBI3293720.1 phosphomannomutase/phosphoglucomutase [Deltaproteobacteria bacterium]
MTVNPSIFREYDIRGVADRDLTDALVINLGKALGTFVARKGGKSVALGYDCRLSSPRLRGVLARGLMATGLSVYDVGMVPTPVLYFATHHLMTDGGVMITGSHNPGEHNGFKICVGPSTIHGDDIQALRKLIEKEDYDLRAGGTSENRPVEEDYISYIVRTVKVASPIRVVIDAGNGMGGKIAAALYREMGCEVVSLFEEYDGAFPNHHPDPTVLENLRSLIDTVCRQKAHVGIGFDGDADRIGVVDASGRPLFGDELLVIFERDVLKNNPGAAIISEVKASHRLFQDIERHGGKAILWKTGHSLIKAKMKESGALLAGEMSGHMFFKDRYFGFDDAIYAGARIIEILSNTRKTAMELLADLPPAVTTPEIRVDCADEIKFEVVQKARKRFETMGLNVNAIDGARVNFSDGWGLVRASNTQPVLVFRFEAENEGRLLEIRSLVEGVVNSCLQ